MAVLGLIRAVQPVGVELAGTYSRNPDVPHVAGAIARGIQVNHPGRHRVLRMIKQLEPNATGMTAEQREVDASRGFIRSQGQRNASSNIGLFGHCGRIIMQRTFGHLHSSGLRIAGFPAL